MFDANSAAKVSVSTVSPSTARRSGSESGHRAACSEVKAGVKPRRRTFDCVGGKGGAMKGFVGTVVGMAMLMVRDVVP